MLLINHSETHCILQCSVVDWMIWRKGALCSMLEGKGCLEGGKEGSVVMDEGQEAFLPLGASDRLLW